MKPQDTLIAIKYSSISTKQAQEEDKNEGLMQPTSIVKISYRELASQVGISVGEASKSIKRLESAKLMIMSNNGIMLNNHNLAEWIVHGAKYAYPVIKVGFGRGMPTAWNCQAIRSDIVPPEPGLGWKSDNSYEIDIQADLVSPIYPSIPFASSIDPFVHKAFALLDILRTGTPREINVSKDMLSKLILEN